MYASTQAVIIILRKQGKFGGTMHKNPTKQSESFEKVKLTLW